MSMVEKGDTGIDVIVIIIIVLIQDPLIKSLLCPFWSCILNQPHSELFERV